MVLFGFILSRILLASNRSPSNSSLPWSIIDLNIIITAVQIRDIVRLGRDSRPPTVSREFPTRTRSTIRLAEPLRWQGESTLAHGVGAEHLHVISALEGLRLGDGVAAHAALHLADGVVLVFA